MLKNDMAQEIFQMLGLCPEDIPIPMEAVALVWKASPEHAAKNAKGIRKVASCCWTATCSWARRPVVHCMTSCATICGTNLRRYKRRNAACIIDAVTAATPEQDWRRIRRWATMCGSRCGSTWLRPCRRARLAMIVPSGLGSMLQSVDRSFVVKTVNIVVLTC